MVVGTAFAFFMLSALLAIPINGFVISVLWAWFITPVFGLREIGISEAVGLAIFLSVILPPRPFPHTDMSEMDSVQVALKMVELASTQIFFAPAFTLFGAWIWHSFMLSARY